MTLPAAGRLQILPGSAGGARAAVKLLLCSPLCLGASADMDLEAAAINGTDRRTDGRTTDRYIDPALYTMWATTICEPSLESTKLSYRRVTARCVLSVVILPITMQHCRNYLYDKS